MGNNEIKPTQDNNKNVNKQQNSNKKLNRKGDRRDGSKNLISLADRPKEERTEIARMGAEASGEARRKKRELTDRIKIGLEFLTKEKMKQAPSEEIKETIKQIGFDVFTVLKAIEKGDLQAIDRLWDRLYGKAVQPTEDLTDRSEPDIKEMFNELKEKAIKKDAKTKD